MLLYLKHVLIIKNEPWVGGGGVTALQEASGDVPLVTFSRVTRMGSHIFAILGVRLFFLLMVSKRTSMFVLQMKMKRKAFSMGQFIKIESD